MLPISSHSWKRYLFWPLMWATWQARSSPLFFCSSSSPPLVRSKATELQLPLRPTGLLFQYLASSSSSIIESYWLASQSRLFLILIQWMLWQSLYVLLCLCTLRLLILVQVLNEVGNLLQGIVKARGDEAVHQIQNVFLPSQNCPPDTAQALVVNIRDMDNKAFRKYFSEFIKSTRPAQ